MMKYFVIILLFFGQCVVAQSSDNSVSRNSIKANFSAMAIKAYEENSFSKVNDFYEFLEIYSNKNSSEALKNQVKENAFSLYKSNIEVTDFYSREKITLEKLFENIKEKGLKFEVKNIRKEMTSNSFWTNSYTLEIRNDATTQTQKITQRIYFIPEEKSFGNKKKEVWTILLADFELN